VTLVDEPPLVDNPELPGKAPMQVSPHNLDAERVVLGGLLNKQAAVSSVVDTLDPSDFYEPAHAHLFATILELHNQGIVPDAALVLQEIRRTGVPVQPHTITACQMDGVALVRPYVSIIVDTATSRKVLAAVEAVQVEARKGTMDAAEMVSLLRDTAASVDAPPSAGEHLAGLDTIDQFLTTSDLTPAPWVIPGLLRQGWRCMVVAPEGVGKSVASRQVAIAAAQGVHPFTHRPIPPVRTLIVDLENPDDAIAETCKPITDRARDASSSYDEGRAWLWRRPDGIDVRTRAGRVALERVIATVKPDLVCLGPMYKAYSVRARENDELAAGEVQRVLDDLRTRHSFSLLLEHHAPKASGLSVRDLVPYGSSLWLRWPELGLTLIPGDGEREAKTSLVVGRFRRDRALNSWPTRLDRGAPGRWPWSGFYENGMDDL